MTEYVYVKGCIGEKNPAKTLRLDGTIPLFLPNSGPTGGAPSNGAMLTSDPLGNMSVMLPPGFIATDAGYLAWTFDPATCATAKAIGLGNIILASIPVRAPVTVTNVVAAVTVAGATLTASANFAGLYAPTGALIASTADQSAVWTTAGVYQMALAGGPFTLQPGNYWVALLANGTTAPTFLAGSLALAEANAGFTAATARGAFSGSGKTALASLTPSANTFYDTIWAALS